MQVLPALDAPLVVTQRAQADEMLVEAAAVLLKEKLHVAHVFARADKRALRYLKLYVAVPQLGLEQPAPRKTLVAQNVPLRAHFETQPRQLGGRVERCNKSHATSGAAF